MAASNSSNTSCMRYNELAYFYEIHIYADLNFNEFVQHFGANVMVKEFHATYDYTPVGKMHISLVAEMWGNVTTGAVYRLVYDTDRRTKAHTFVKIAADRQASLGWFYQHHKQYYVYFKTPSCDSYVYVKSENATFSLSNFKKTMDVLPVCSVKPLSADEKDDISVCSLIINEDVKEDEQ